jgi:hypothetical protein
LRLRRQLERLPECADYAFGKLGIGRFEYLEERPARLESETQFEDTFSPEDVRDHLNRDGIDLVGVEDTIFHAPESVMGPDQLPASHADCL